MTKNDWKGFERLVAAINATKMNNADVRWNDEIDGRQFDVTIPFQAGDYKFLTVIECKNYASKIPVEKVEAFVTKSRGVKANKAVMFSRCGFQSGCKTVAEQYGIELFEVNEEYEVPERLLDSSTSHAINVCAVSLCSLGQKVLNLDNDAKLHYLLRNTQLTIPNEKTITLDKFIQKYVRNHNSELTQQEQILTISLPDHTKASLADQKDRTEISEIQITVKIIDAFVTKQPVPDFHLTEKLNRKAVIRNTLGNTTNEIPFTEIKHGFDTQLKEKTFYQSVCTEFHYYCDKIRDGLAKMILLESYQHGRRVDVRFTIAIENGTELVEITNPKTLEHLNEYLIKFRKNEAKHG